MKISDFIKKPVLSSVISILIVIAGVIALRTLPIEQYPDIAPPMVSISAFYNGASASTIQKSVIAPIEEAVNGVENMIYMTSSANNAGEVSISVYFKQGTDPDMATVNVQNRVSQAEPRLPAEVKQYGLTVTKQMNSILQMFTISSPDEKFDDNFISNYLNINLKPKILRVSGVGKVMIFGADYSMRIWLKPEVLASFNMSPKEVIAALADQNIEAATGTFGENSPEQLQYSMVYSGRLKTVEEFKNIVIRTSANGEILHLGTVADIELGKENYLFSSKTNGHSGAVCVVYQTAGSNAKVVNDNITALLEEEQRVQPDLDFTVMMNTNDFLNASMHDVIKTLLEALLLVVLIVLLFLHDWQSTVIPFVGIMVSLIGTFAFMLVAGFSINLISLFALVLVIGTVVDDSIVVVEAVHEKLDAGYKSSRKAATDAMGEITTAVITSSLVFMAVFIPISMLSGTSGTFFRQFGLTMAVAVGISALNALTLVPALCAIMIKPKSETANPNGKHKLHALYQRLCVAFDTAFVGWSEKYKNGIRPLIKRPWIPVLVVVASAVVMVWAINTTPSGFVPQEDKGSFICDILMPTGTTVNKTSITVEQIAERVKAIDEVKDVACTAGYGFSCGQMSNAGFLLVSLKNWDERDFLSVKKVMAEVSRIGKEYADAQVIPFQMPMIPGYGSSSDAEINLQDKTDADIADFAVVRDDFVKALNQHPAIEYAYSTFTADNPQWLVTVDASKCYQKGVTVQEVMNTLAIYMGGSYVNDINLYGKVYKVMVQGTPESHVDEKALNYTMVKTPSGEMAPIATFVTLKRIYGAPYLNRFNMLSSIQVSASPAPGASSGSVIQAVKETADQILPARDYSIEFGGMTREQSEGSSMLLIFGISALLIYLVLACLYESYVVPFSIMLAVPLGLMGAFLFTKIAGAIFPGVGIDNNIYLQTGVVMLIGLLSKTGILIVEFALQKRHEGLSIVDSALEASKARLRPILMTAATMVIGLIPLLTSRGVGAVGNISLGIGAVFGMLIGCIGLLFLVPALYVVFETIQEKIHPIKSDTDNNE